MACDIETARAMGVQRVVRRPDRGQSVPETPAPRAELPYRTAWIVFGVLLLLGVVAAAVWLAARPTSASTRTPDTTATGDVYVQQSCASPVVADTPVPHVDSGVMTLEESGALTAIELAARAPAQVLYSLWYDEQPIVVGGQVALTAAGTWAHLPLARPLAVTMGHRLRVRVQPAAPGQTLMAHQLDGTGRDARVCVRMRIQRTGANFAK
jgi:hypothetical protein